MRDWYSTVLCSKMVNLLRCAAAARLAALQEASLPVQIPPASRAAVSQGACCTVHFAAVQEEQKGRVSNELATVLSQISVACKQIASLVCRAGIADMTGVAGLQNISGEDQKKLDVISNEVFSNCLRSSGRTVRPRGSSSSVHPVIGQASLHCACGATYLFFG